MRILLVCPYDLGYPGGVQNHVIQYAKKLKGLGHYVTVIAPTSRQNFLYEAADINLVSAGLPFAVPFGRGSVGRLTYDVRRLPALWRELNRDSYDITHLHEPENPSLLGPPALLLANSSSGIIAVTFHSNFSRSRLAGFYSAVAKVIQMHRLMDKVDVRLAVSETARDSISRYLPGDYAVIPNGINVDSFSPDVLPREEFLDGKVNILVVTRMGNNERRKGLEYVVSAFDKLQSRQANTRLIIVGPGKPDTKTSKLLGKINTDNIMFVGAVSGKELPGYYASAHIFCAYSTDKESFGIVLAEAMASGKPVVASNIEGYRNVLTGTNSLEGRRSSIDDLVVTEPGMLVPPRDADKLAEALEILIKNQEQRQQMGEKGRQFVVDNFSWDVVAPQILSVCEKAIAAKKV